MAVSALLLIYQNLPPFPQRDEPDANEKWGGKKKNSVSFFCCSQRK